MKTQILLITPQLAAEFLKRNLNNRKLRDRHVKKLAKEMSNGKWVLNGEPIQFNNKGELINGQHRLHAIVLSNVSVYILVVSGIEDENAFATIDQNSLSRGAHTVLQMKGVNYAPIMVSISKKLIHWKNTHDKFNFSFNNNAYKEVSSSDVVDFYEENETDILFVFEAIRDARLIKTCGARSALMAALYICYKANPKTAPRFISMLKSGIGLQDQSPVLLLREKLTYSVPKEGGRLWDQEVMALTIKAFNAYSERKTRKILRWTEKEKFPIPIQAI
jgi:hypothetical protein